MTATPRTKTYTCAYCGKIQTFLHRGTALPWEQAHNAGWHHTNGDTYKCPDCWTGDERRRP